MAVETFEELNELILQKLSFIWRTRNVLLSFIQTSNSNLVVDYLMSNKTFD